MKFASGVHQNYLPALLSLPVVGRVVLGVAGQLQQDPCALLCLPAQWEPVMAGHLQFEIFRSQRLLWVVQDRVVVQDIVSLPVG